jgi:uncharacterized protein YjbJ (UPF0337 family)
MEEGAVTMGIPKQDEGKGTIKQGMGREKERIGQWIENPDLETEHETQRHESDLQGTGEPGRPAGQPREFGERSRR